MKNRIEPFENESNVELENFEKSKENDENPRLDGVI